MTYRYDPDDVIATWAAESTGGGKPDYLPEVLLMVERTPQHRWARWVPGAGTTSPAKAPAMSTRAVLVVAAALLLLLVGGALVAGSLRRPAFQLHGVLPVPGSVGVPFLSASDGKLWSTVTGGVLSIDPETGATVRYEVPNSGTDLTGVIATDDAIWVADYVADRVVRLDKATGAVTDQVAVPEPMGLVLQDGLLWTLDHTTGGATRIDQATREVDLRLPSASSFAVAPGVLWYVTSAGGESFAVEVDPATGIERQRVAIPLEAADAITIDAAGNPWVYRGRRDQFRSTILKIDAASGTAGTSYDVPYDVIGGVVPVGSSMWAFTAVNSPNGSQAVELGATGPTGRVEPLEDGLDPDVPTVALGSVWIPWDNRAMLYRYPADALAP